MELTKVKYKQTEVGLIPEDWAVKKIVEISNPVRGGSPRPAGSPKYFNGDFIPWLTVASLTNISDSQIYVYRTNSFLTEAGSYLSRTLDVDTLIIANSGATLGVAKLLGIKCCANDGVAALLDIHKDISSKYLVYFINSITKKLREDIATGNGQPNLNTELIGNISLPLPPTLTEQKAIATALSDVDDLISNLDKLITKKKAIKQGAMQQLLTPPHKGGKRLAGFTGEWVEKSIGKIGATYGGLSGKSKNDFENGNHPYITFLNVMNNTVIDTSIFEYVKIGSAEQQNQARKGDLFFNTSSETPEEVGMCAYLNEDVHNLYLNSFCFGFRLKEDCEIDGLFFSYLINSSIGRKLFLSLAQGATRYNLSKSNFNKLFIDVPSIDEQKAVVQILSDLDAEIEQLETKKAKYQDIKQGMMQELLTGKTRLV